MPTPIGPTPWRQVHGPCLTQAGPCQIGPAPPSAGSLVPGVLAPAHVAPCSLQMYNFTSFAMVLNEVDKDMENVIPKTDCRLRPDIRAMENGEIGTWRAVLREGSCGVVVGSLAGCCWCARGHAF